MFQRCFVAVNVLFVTNQDLLLKGVFFVKEMFIFFSNMALLNI